MASYVCVSRSIPFTAMSLSERFSQVMAGLQRAVAARAPQDRVLATIAMVLWNRLGRMARHFSSIAERVRAGRGVRAVAWGLPGPRGERAHTSLPREPGAARAPWPREFGWLLRLVPGAGFSSGQLQDLLAEPEMAEVLAASPQARRLMRSLCRMLAITPGPELALPPQSKRARPEREAGDGGEPPDTALHTPAPRVPAPRAGVRRERERVPRTPGLGSLRWRPAGGAG